MFIDWEVFHDSTDLQEIAGDTVRTHATLAARDFEGGLDERSDYFGEWISDDVTSALFGFRNLTFEDKLIRGSETICFRYSKTAITFSSSNLRPTSCSETGSPSNSF